MMQKADSMTPTVQACEAFRPIGQVALNLFALQSLRRLEARKVEAGHD